MNEAGSPLEIYQAEIALGTLVPDRGQFKVVRRLDSLYRQLLSPAGKRRWYQRFVNRGNRAFKGYYLWGGVGTGKTMVMDIFYQALPGGFAKRTHFHTFMQGILERKNEIRDRQDPLAVIVKEYASDIKVLCLDEFSVTDIADAMILSGLLHHLFRRNMVLVTTSNTRPDDLYRDGLQRARFLPAIELLKTHTHPLNVDGGTDYRMAYLQDRAIFHTPLGDGADTALKDCFSGLVGKNRDNNRTVTIAGREIEIVAMGLGVIWFDFHILCQTHRSKLDYIEIAKQFHTVLLSNIPPLGNDQNDAARRFIELIDEFYDRNVNFVVSSAQPPDRIYTGKRLAEPFKRTASRLNEMSSEHYLSRPHLS